jgi:hypothetical protein
MGWRQTVGWVVAAALAGPAGAAGQQHCRLEGTEYPENAMVCSRGIVLHCENGVWQSNSGQRCDDRDGAYLTPLRPYQQKSDEPIPPYLKEQYPFLDR